MKLLEEGAPLESDEERVTPNYPKGYRYEAWNIDDIMANMREGKAFDLGPGDWS